MSNDLTGQRFGRLTVLKKVGIKGKNSNYLCVCDCGNELEVIRPSLVDGSTMSCGCLKADLDKNIGPKLKELAGFVEGTCVSVLKSGLSKVNKSGVKGVCWDKTRKKWVAQITFKQKHYNLGRYSDIEQAKKVRKIAEEKLFGEFLEWYEKEYKSKVDNANNPPDDDLEGTGRNQ
ncbi:AP2 domain-containing protein [Geosporobacter subterraneus DSM 17957]|uniref:AP2 domain-containing protein n=1 Tax=Geosporobacter subterraneus DSM 17957 TaxID=1121919 RepID=A0A1M6DN05_9FIRM|nr:AP2/ERF family transcription factor [Geosporobacter subterraneus]SHI74626.1 AP2 domain-containing protein [Geosporobacter subterraneus DSM 17957]